MSKLLKILFRFIGGILEWTLILLIIVAFAIRSSKFQTYLGQQATAYLSDEMHTTIHVEKVSILFFDRFALDGVLVLDEKKDTLASVSSVFLTLNSFDNKRKFIDIKEVNLKKGIVRINRDKQNGKFNFQFLADYFSSGDTTASEPFAIKLNHIKVSQLDFKYDDYRKEFSPFGMDYDHLHFRNLYLSSKLKLKKSGGIEGFVKHLSFREKSGFEIDRFSGKLAFDNKGLRTKYLRIVTPESKILFSKLNLNIKESADFSEFVDKVVFDIEMKKSIISLEDVSYFAQNLEGMKDKIVMEAEISKAIKELKIANLDLRTGRRTHLKGTFNLPDFRELDKAFFNEKIAYAYVDFKDIENILLPKSSKERKIKIANPVRRLNHVELIDFRLDGFYSQFVVKSDHINTALGAIEMDNGIMFTEHKEKNSFTFEKSYAGAYDVKIDSFLLGPFLADKTIGRLSGDFFLQGEIFSSGDIAFNSIQGKLDRMGYMDYSYKNVMVEEGSFINNVFEGVIRVKDENLDMRYAGTIDLNNQQNFDFTLDIALAELNRLNFSETPKTVLTSRFDVKIHGTNTDNYSGSINIDDFTYKEGEKHLGFPEMKIEMVRDVKEDHLTITSPLADLQIDGKVDFSSIGDDVQNQLNKILPAIIKSVKPQKNKKVNKFDYSMQAKDLNDFLSIFAPELELANGTSISGNYDGTKNQFEMNLNSAFIKYENIEIENLVVRQVVTDSIMASFKVDRLSLNDSLSVQNASFLAYGNNGEINSELRWNPATENESYFSWKTIVNDAESYFFNLNPSYFSVKGRHWDIVNNSQVSLAPNNIQIQNFKMQRENQFLTIDGKISKNKEDILRVVINDLELEDFAHLLGLPVNIKGQLNGVASLSDLFNDIDFSSDASIRDLLVDNEEIGDINLRGAWVKHSQAIEMKGELYYRKNKTFNFSGRYFLAREKDNLDFNLHFDYTDLQFTNAFMDPLVVSGIRGLVNGELKVTGTPDAPEIDGKIMLHGGNAKVEMFGVNFGFNGEIMADKDGIYIDNMPVIDEDGNAGSLVGTVFHNNFQDWSFDLDFNLLDDAYAMQNGFNFTPLERFLVMNTTYKEGDIYYGKAYVRGTANIFGYAENMQITVDLETQADTKINFPMYGASDIGEDQFITFVPRVLEEEEAKINLSGVNMDLNFKVTPDAELKIIFDETIGDVITAHGKGDIGISLDNLNDVRMNGTFEITKDSKYHFVMPPVEQDFYIEEGGTIGWSGDPYIANLNLKTYAVIKTDVSELMPSVESSNAKVTKEVRCYLNMSQTLSDPLVTFDIVIPKASESDNAALNRVKADKDLLNKEFFSLLLVKKFQPIDGSLSAGAGAAYDLINGKVNDALDKLSQDVKYKVAIGSKSAQLGVQKNLYGNRLILKGSFGVENSSTTSTQGQGSFIGDINLEYLINESGTFRVSIFNQSNDNTVIQEKNLGLFTQGAGLNYQEDFNNFRDFQMLQYFLDVFRKKEEKYFKVKKKSRQKLVPVSGTQPSQTQ